MKGAIELKKETHKEWHACGTPEAAESYQQPILSAARVVTDAKTLVWDKFGEPIEQVFQSAPKKFSETVWWLRRGEQNPVHMVSSMGGGLLNSPESIVWQ